MTDRLRVLLVHDYYQQPGGEDESFRVEAELLRREGCRVLTYTRNNAEWVRKPRILQALGSIWNHKTYRDIRRLLRREKIDVAVFQNTFPIVSPSGYYAARAGGAAVVQVLRNYRLLCPSSTLYRDGRVCELCVTRGVKWPAALHRCYKSSVAASAAVSIMLLAHRIVGTWSKAVDVYVVLTDVAKSLYVRGGFPAERVTVRANVMDGDPGPGLGDGEYVLFAGRLSPEKGISELLDAWESTRDLPLLIVAGDGPMHAEVRRRTAALPHVKWIQYQERDRLLELLGAARLLIFPSVWYEGMPRIIIESFAKGTPVVAFGVGAAAVMITHGVNGLKVERPTGEALAASVRRALRDSDAMRQMRSDARRTFETRYSAGAGVAGLMSSLETAMAYRDKRENPNRHKRGADA